MKRKVLQKSIALVLTTAMCTSLFVGCGSSDSATSSSSSSSSTSEAGEVCYDANGNVTGMNFPLEEDMEFTFHYHARNMYVFDEEWPVYQELAEITGISLVNTGNIVLTNSEEAIQLQAIEGFPSDLYGGNNTADYFMQYGPDGAFIALNDYWEYMPNFRAYLDANPEVEGSITAEDGNIYHMPYIQEGDVARTYFIRTDWLDNLGLDIPVTTDDYEAVLYAFLEQDANGNGDTSDEIPYFNDKWNEMIRLVNLWDARCYSQDDYSQRIIPNEDGTMYHAWTADEFRDAIVKLSQWYTDGIIDQEIWTKGNSSRKEYIPGDIGGSTHEWVASTSAYNSTVTDVEGFELSVIAPPITSEGNQWEEHQRLLCKPDGWAVSINCDTPEYLFAYMDYFWTEEGRILSNFGVEGTDWEYDEDGNPQFVEEVLNSDTAVNTYLESEVGAQLKQGYWMYYEYEIQWTDEEFGQPGVAMYQELGLGDSVTQLPAMSWTKEEKTVVDNLMTALNDYQDEMVQRWISSSNNELVLEEWDSYIATCESYGVEQLLDVYETSYQRLLSVGE
ncbi:MAG: hypothetical protein R3Y47_03365 [Lachnospiraceae bacterium]